MNNLRISFRSLMKRKGITLLNMVGLSIGIATALIMGLYVIDEYSYDRHHENREVIHRVIGSTADNPTSGSAYTSPPMGPAILKDFPEVVNFARVDSHGEHSVTVNNVSQNKRIMAVDPSFFEMFTVNTVHGDLSKAFENRMGVVITDETAIALFGKTDVAGETVNIFNRDFTVDGVVEKEKGNTHFEYDLLLFFEIFVGTEQLAYWGRNFHETYVQLNEEADVAAMKEKLLGLRDRYEENPTKLTVTSQPLLDMHLNTKISNAFGVSGNKQYVNIALIACILIILMVSINFMNISLASGLDRLKEVGIRKVLGSGKRSLIVRFITEVVISTLIAASFSLLLADLLLGPFNATISKNLSLADYLEAFSASNFALLVIGFISLLIVMAGVYPAIYFSRLQVLHSLKGQVAAGLGKGFLRRVLVTLQYVLSMTMITFALVVSAQINFIQNKDLGWDKENLVHFPTTRSLVSSYDAFKGAMLQNPSILNVTAVSELPLAVNTGGTFTFEGQNPDKVYTITYMNADKDFFEAFRLESSDEFPIPEVINDEVSNYAINESALRMMREEWGADESPIGKKIDDGIIVGVVKDFHHQALYEEVSPIMYGLAAKDNYGRYSTYVARLAPGNPRASLEHIQSTIRQFDEEFEFDLKFIDDTMMAMYENETMTRTIVNSFSILAILISCLGIYGLVAMDAERRRKELSIRKVLGADGVRIVSVVSKKFLINLALGGGIALPVSIMLADKWLASFAYRIDSIYGYFVITVTISFIISLLTIGMKMIRSVGQNPIVALREE